MDFGTWRVVVRRWLRRLDCWPCEAVVVEAVPFARHRARFTRDMEDLLAWLIAHTDKTAVTRLVRINWRTTGTTIRAHRAGILAALELGITNGRSEGLNRKVRTITSRASGFHSANAVAAMIMLCCGPVQLHLPHDHWPDN